MSIIESSPVIARIEITLEKGFRESELASACRKMAEGLAQVIGEMLTTKQVTVNNQLTATLMTATQHLEAAVHIIESSSATGRITQPQILGPRRMQ